MKTILMHPPLDDPTVPYHSTAYLAGHLRKQGFHEVATRDINIEFVNYCMEEDAVREFRDETERRLEKLSAGVGMSFQAQEEYHRLATARFAEGPRLRSALAVVRNRERFLDYAEYVGSVRRLIEHFEAIGALSYPLEFDGFTPKTRGRLSFYSVEDLLDTRLGARICYPLTLFFERRLNSDSQLQNADLLGISLIYDHQLFHALHLARLFKAKWPSKKVVFGGTAISQLYKYLKDKSQIKRFFAFCDAIVIGEGETAICQMVESGGALENIRELRNTLTLDPAGKLRIPRIEYENLDELGTPIFDYRWDLYFSPERAVNYAPTRGCYWNRCTFCDYGLNTNAPTSPWRERKVSRVVEDLVAAQKNFGVKYVYFAVDVMAPGYLERLSDAMVDSELDIRWAAEIRMEKIFTPERCAKLRKSGCVCISFGMESGSQRVLDLIDKGTKVANMGETMKRFSNAGIAVQLMAFSDFPTETAEEKAETAKFVALHQEHYSAGGIGAFLLTGTSMIAKNPAQYGITVVDTPGADVARAVAYRMNSTGGQKVNLTEDADASFNETASMFPTVLGRPWAGGTDTLHSMIYYEHFGQRFFREHQLPSIACPPGEWRDWTVSLKGVLVDSAVDFGEIFSNRELFASYVQTQLNEPREPTYSEFIKWEAGIAAATVKPEAASQWLITAREAVKLNLVVYRLLSLGSKQKLTIGKLLSGFPPAVRDNIVSHFVQLERQGLLSFDAASPAVERG
jgi:anaerobic magnesium-protoporphyrin IX monomethyl ester cyclase